MQQVIRRLASIPTPYADECFGSWLVRLALSHHVSLEAFVAALLKEAGHPMESDLNCFRSPSSALLNILSERTGWSRARLNKLLVPRSRRSPDLKFLDQPYCRQCWFKPTAEVRSDRYMPRRWCERWSVMCEQHQSPLLTCFIPIDYLFTERAIEDLLHFPDPDQLCFDPVLNAALTTAQREILTLEARGTQSVESQERAQVLRDLALLAGTRFPNESLVNWSLSRRGVHFSQLYWQDGRDHKETDAAASKPNGHFRVRRHALRIATLLVLEMEGIHQIDRQEDLMIRTMLRILEPQTPLAWAINALRRTWPERLKAQWDRAFLWSDDRDPVIWARREAPSLSSMWRRAERRKAHRKRAHSRRGR